MSKPSIKLPSVLSWYDTQLSRYVDVYPGDYRYTIVSSSYIEKALQYQQRRKSYAERHQYRRHLVTQLGIQSRHIRAVCLQDRFQLFAQRLQRGPFELITTVLDTCGQR